MFGGDLDDFRIWLDRRIAEVAKNHLAIARRNLLPLAEHDVIHGLLNIELGDRSDRRAEAAEADGIVHFLDHVVVLVHQIVVAHHLRVGGQRAARHRGPNDDRISRHRLRRNKVFRHRVLKDVLRLADLLDIETEIILTVAKCMPEGDDVRLAGAARYRCHRDVNAIRAAIQGRKIAGQTVARRFMRMELNMDFVANEFAGEFDRFTNRARSRGSGGVLEAEPLKRNASIEDFLDAIRIERRGVRAAAFDTWRQPHQGNGNFVR